VDRNVGSKVDHNTQDTIQCHAECYRVRVKHSRNNGRALTNTENVRHTVRSVRDQEGPRLPEGVGGFCSLDMIRTESVDLGVGKLIRHCFSYVPE